MQRSKKGDSLVVSVQNFVVVDIETTGLSPDKDHIIEIGAIKYECNSITKTFQQLVRPPKRNDGRYVTSQITKITGITDSMLEVAYSEEHSVSEFFKFLGTSIIVGHNVTFDINFLYDACMRVIGKPIQNNYIDTMKLSRMYLPDLEHHTLQDTSDYFKVVNPRAHRALQDCLTTGNCYRIFQKYIEGRHSR